MPVIGLKREIGPTTLHGPSAMARCVDKTRTLSVAEGLNCPSIVYGKDYVDGVEMGHAGEVWREHAYVQCNLVGARIHGGVEELGMWRYLENWERDFISHRP